MVCPACGAFQPEGVPVCAACGHAMTDGVPQVRYAGFWLRLVAYAMDTILLGFFFLPIFGYIFQNAGITDVGQQNPFDPTFLQQHPDVFFLVEAISFVGSGLYFSVMESSPWQATLGKRALGLRVTDLHGARLSFGRATARYFAKLVSGLTLMIGYVMAAFTAKKQALHDQLVGTLVLRK
jgi:uncharacterized RDD family membrane protein YckC